MFNDLKNDIYELKRGINRLLNVIERQQKKIDVLTRKLEKSECKTDNRSETASNGIDVVKLNEQIDISIDRINDIIKRIEMGEYDE